MDGNEYNGIVGKSASFGSRSGIAATHNQKSVAVVLAKLVCRIREGGFNLLSDRKFVQRYWQKGWAAHGISERTSQQVVKLTLDFSRWMLRLLEWNQGRGVFEASRQQIGLAGLHSNLFCACFQIGIALLLDWINKPNKRIGERFTAWTLTCLHSFEWFSLNSQGITFAWKLPYTYNFGGVCISVEVLPLRQCLLRTRDSTT